MDSLLKLVTLSAREKWLLAQSLLLLPVNLFALHLMSFNRWQAILCRLAPIDRAGAEPVNESMVHRVNQTIRMVRVAASRGPLRGNCLQKSLALWWLLRRQNIDSEIRFGARRDNGNFEAHAWVEFRGVALNEEPAVQQSFTPFVRGTAAAEAKIR